MPLLSITTSESGSRPFSDETKLEFPARIFLVRRHAHVKMDAMLLPHQHRLYILIIMTLSLAVIVLSVALFLNALRGSEKRMRL
jgi:hypothetical protein